MEHFDELDRRFNNTETLTELSHRLMLQAASASSSAAPKPRIDVQTIIEFVGRTLRPGQHREASRSTAALYSAI
ncbi:MAG: hypothetical protein ACLSVD_10340 [Eggerthellaceae bacterium]